MKYYRRRIGSTECKKHTQEALSPAKPHRNSGCSSSVPFAETVFVEQQQDVAVAVGGEPPRGRKQYITRSKAAKLSYACKLAVMSNVGMYPAELILICDPLHWIVVLVMALLLGLGES
ncbi:hypothetical protein D5086_005791 [Populus alba]|uniref:Uncharacterized protein n=2 Tax=Populus alba TaxID=43335 RepID=A0A4U5Q8Y2_POPAL|nr:hypothetical protein D5086_0000124650 [Populus alba]